MAALFTYLVRVHYIGGDIDTFTGSATALAQVTPHVQEILKTLPRGHTGITLVEIVFGMQQWKISQGENR